MKQIYFPLLVIFIYLFLVFNKIHSSSIGFYHQFFYGQKKDANLIFGQPRSIRSDEWLVGTPKVIGQVKAGFPVINKNIGLGEVMPIQGCSPYQHWRVVFCPNVWPFFFLPLEYAYSASWWFLNLLMILAVYYFILFLTNSIFVAIASSLVFFFTPFNQWWTYSLTSFLGYGLLFVIFFIKAAEKNKTMWKSIFFLLVSGYFLVSYAFILYPPFQVAAFYILGFVLIGILWQKKLMEKKAIIFGVAVIFLVLISVVSFYLEFKEAIKVLQNTVYPGKRFVSNSLGNFLYLINGFYNIQLLDDFKGSGPFANQSEASNFFMISLFSLPVYFWVVIDQIKKKKIDWFFLSLMFSFMILLIWFLFPLPSIVAKLSLLFLVPQKRALIGIGIVNYLLAIYFLTRVKVIKNSFHSYLKWFSAFLIFFTNLHLGFLFKFNYPVFIQNNIKIFLLSFISGLLVYLLLTQKKKLFLISLLIFSLISTYRVNPLYKGLDPLTNTELAKFIQEKIEKEGNQHSWINYSTIHLENYFLANGAKSMTGVFYHPQYQLMKILDQKSEYQLIWNRYAHVNYFYKPNLKQRFILFSADNYGINLNPCDEIFKLLQAKYFLSDSTLSQKCLKLEKRILRFKIYSRSDI